MVSSGLARALISIDALHQEFVPFKYVLCALRALRDAGVETMKALITFVDRQKGLPVDQETERLLSILHSEPGIIPDIRPQASFIGRAISALNPYAPQMSVDEAPNASKNCESVSENLSASSFYTVGPENKVLVCPGFAYPGDLHSMEFKDIMPKRTYQGTLSSPDSRPRVSTVFSIMRLLKVIKPWSAMSARVTCVCMCVISCVPVFRIF